MGESSRNYQNGKIYCIRNHVDDDIYIGSSCQPLSKRMAWHRNNSKSKNHESMKIYSKIHELGVEQFYIELVEECPCDTVEQLRKREGEIIREMKPELNKRVEGRTRKEYYEDNKNMIREKAKQYYNENRETISEYRQKYRQDNKEKIKQQDKIKYEKHIDKIRCRRTQYYQDNKNIILEKQNNTNNKIKTKSPL